MTTPTFACPQPHAKPSAAEVLISGAGIAGTVLAYWLARGGLRPTVIERSPQIRRGGNAVDLRGPAVDVVAGMGVLAELRGHATGLAEFHRISPSGQRLVTMAPEIIGGDIEVLRTELNAVLFAAAQDGVTYRFGDSIAALEDIDQGVAVTFDSGLRREFDIVIGADGLHSQTRALAFGPEGEYVQHLGCYQAHFTMDNILGLEHSGLLLNQPDRTVGCYSVHQDREIVVGLFFNSPPVDYDRTDIAAQRDWVRTAFADMGWRTADLLDAMDSADDFYFDSIAQVAAVPPYRGRIALVGDAAYSPSLLSGMGATLAIVGATVLAEELVSSADDYECAFGGYHGRMTELISLSHQLARASRGWFIQSGGRQHRHRADAADTESDILRQQVLDAAAAAYAARPSR